MTFAFVFSLVYINVYTRWKNVLDTFLDNQKAKTRVKCGFSDDFVPGTGVYIRVVVT